MLPCLPSPALRADNRKPDQGQETDEAVLIDTDALQAKIHKKGLRQRHRRRQLPRQEDRGARPRLRPAHHGLPWPPAGGTTTIRATRRCTATCRKHYVEGPQICTQAKELKPEIIRGKDFVAVRLRYRFTKPGKGFKAGSTWEQTLVFQPGVRYFLCGERITSVNDVDDLFYRIDMPGHIRHKGGDNFHAGLPELSRQADPRRGVHEGLRPRREVPLPAQGRQGARSG